MTKAAGNFGFGHIYEKILTGKPFWCRECVKKTSVYFNEIILLIKMKIKNSLGIDTAQLHLGLYRHGHKYTKYEKCLSMMMLMCTKYHLSKIGVLSGLRQFLATESSLKMMKNA